MVAFAHNDVVCFDWDASLSIIQCYFDGISMRICSLTISRSSLISISWLTSLDTLMEHTSLLLLAYVFISVAQGEYHS